MSPLTKTRPAIYVIGSSFKVDRPCDLLSTRVQYTCGCVHQCEHKVAAYSLLRPDFILSNIHRLLRWGSYWMLAIYVHRMQAAIATIKPFTPTLLTVTMCVGPTVSMWCAHMVNVSAILTIVADASALARR